MTKKLNRRQWLRPNNSWGPASAIFTSVTSSAHKWRKDDGSRGVKRSLGGSFALRDCSREVSLDLYADSRKNANAHLTAIDKLIGELEMLRDVYAYAALEIDDAGWDTDNSE